MKDEKNATKKDGLAIAKRISDSKYNLIGEDGKIISDEWYRYVDYFKDLAVVQRTNGEQCKIDKTGEIIVCK